METYITKTGLEIIIRYAYEHDVSDIIKLNRMWTVTTLDNIDTRYGFLFCQTYKAEDLIKICCASELAVAFHASRLIGYFMCDNYSSLLSAYENAISKSIANGLLPQGSRISKRTQIVVDKDYQNMGIPKQMLLFLIPKLQERYDILFSIGINQNPKSIAHQKAGWKIIYQDDEQYYIVYYLKEL